MRIATAVLAGVSLFGLTACGDEKATTGGTEAAAPVASADAPKAEATTPAAAAAPEDKVVCEEANKAGESFSKAFIALAKTTGGEVAPADAKLMMADFAKGLTEAAGTSTTEVGKNVLIIAAETTKATEAADPASAIDSPESGKASKALNAACKSAGVKTNF
ncbi:hypothetical protein GCM10009828_020830 [Actinoplanes couchii]|uniref:Lipoprotein n=1 Tax=Actinoplanes couchii TaxID=403638 RepID=A0ABQ3XHQ1_9ACTN|nr:hypothetical protein Aco03nite_064350 [Actinoplanes couchii]